MVKGFSVSGTVSITSSSLVVIFQIILTISLLHSFRVSPISNYYKSIQYTALGTFTCLAIAFIDWIVEECLYRLHPDQDIWVPFYAAFFILVAMSLILFYAFMLLRLVTTFEETHYKIQKCFVQSHICIIVTVALITPFAVIAEFMGYRFIFYALLLALMCVYFIGLLHLTYAFNKKLFQITLSIKEAISPKPKLINPKKRSRSIRTSSLGDKQLVLLSTIRKHTLLGFIILLMILMDIMIVIVYSTVIQLYIFWCIGWAVTMNIATLCIYLGFAVNLQKYNCLCEKCDMCCEIVCNGIAEGKMIAATSTMIQVSNCSTIDITGRHSSGSGNTSTPTDNSTNEFHV